MLASRRLRSPPSLWRAATGSPPSCTMRNRRWCTDLATSCARACVSARRTVASEVMYQALSSTTVTPTIRVTPATCLALILIIDPVLLGIGRRALGLHPVEFVVQGLEAHTQHLGRPGLVAAGMVQRDLNQLTLDLVYR